MATPKLIGLIGHARSGKTTTGEILGNCYGYRRIQFAEPLKRMLAELGLGFAELEGTKKETPCAMLGGKTPRFAMQTLGTEWGRNMIHPNLWVDYAMRQVREHRGHVVIEDVRFQSEADAIRKAGGELWRISRGSLTISQHISESGQSLLEADWVIHNNGTLRELAIKVERLLDRKRMVVGLEDMV